MAATKTPQNRSERTWGGIVKTTGVRTARRVQNWRAADDPASRTPCFSKNSPILPKRARIGFFALQMGIFQGFQSF
ncbi:MAG: hypothetical protein ACRCUY_07010 [Thermoguttaceae bacterium]